MIIIITNNNVIKFKDNNINEMDLSCDVYPFENYLLLFRKNSDSKLNRFGCDVTKEEVRGNVIIYKKGNKSLLNEFESNDEVAEVMLYFKIKFSYLKIELLDNFMIDEKLKKDKNDSSYITFGRYPQKIITDESLIIELDKIDKKNSFGYIELTGSEYQRLHALGNSIITCQGKTYSIKKDKNYYFEVLPLSWEVLYDFDDIILCSDKVIDCYYYNKQKHNMILCDKSIDENDYYFSDIRKYLNRYFLDKAFTKNEKERIITYVSDDVLEEKVSLVSKDILSYLKNVCCEATDYASCVGAVELNEKYHVGWWLKSCGSDSDKVLSVKDDTRKLLEQICFKTRNGIRPIIHITK